MSVSAKRSRRVGAVSHVALALLAFIAASVLLRPLLPGGTQHERTEVKFGHFRAHKDEFSLAFFGSSRVFRGFDPHVFDGICAEHGIATRSFNFGIGGSHAIEIEHLLLRVHALAPRLDFVLIDPEDLNLPALHENLRARSVIDWHDLETTRFVTGLIASQPLGKLEKLELIVQHWNSWLYNQANVGRGLGWFDRWLGIEPSAEFIALTLGPHGNGYSADARERRERRFELKGREEYLASLAEFERKQPTGAPPSAAALELYRRMQRLVKDLGAQTVFVTLPALYIQNDLLGAHAAGEVELLLSYHDPLANAELYVPESREDGTHLNAEGARVFSEKLARDFVAFAKRVELGK